MKILKKVLSGLLAVSVLGGCADTDTGSSAEETGKQNPADVYTELSGENHFEAADRDTLVSILTHGTAIVFLGFPECPWCQAYVPMLEEELAANDAHCAYYNIYADKTADREYYDAVASLLVSQNDTGDEIIAYDNDGKQVIYMPLVLFVEKGRIIACDNETCTEDAEKISPEDYWTEEKKEALKEKLDADIARIAEKQAENSSKGCDTGCKVGEVVSSNCGIMD